MIYNYIFIGWNIFVALIYGVDKLLAIRKKRRVSEKKLLFLAFLLGGFGAMFGMIIFNHKTSKRRFRFLVPVFAIVNIVFLYIIQRSGAL
jgi:uncharacterized membrane protein YsdA (DUF1294 family)